MINYPDDSFVESPDELDGAEVLFWAYNPSEPFFIMNFTDGKPYTPIHGFAICRYPGESNFYKFSCNKEWKVENDIDAQSMEEAKLMAASQTQQKINWNKK